MVNYEHKLKNTIRKAGNEMLTLKIANQDIKSFMNTLLRTEVMDFFEVRSVDIHTFTHFNISGEKIPQKAEVPAEPVQEKKAAVDDKNAKPEDKPIEIQMERIEKPTYSKWSEIKPYAFDIIKGQAKPRYIKIVFSLDQEKAKILHQNAAAMHLNIQFNGEEAYITSATSQLKFALDKTVDHAWEDYLRKFFAKHGVQAKAVEME